MIQHSFNSHYIGKTSVSRNQNVSILDLLELRMMEVVVTTGAIGRAKFQSNHHQQRTNIQHLTGQIPFRSPSVKSLKGNGK